MTTSIRMARMTGEIQTSGDYLLWILPLAVHCVSSPYFQFAARVWRLEIGRAGNSWLFLRLKNYNEGKESDLVSLGLKMGDKYLLRSAYPDESGRIFTVNKVIQSEELHSSNPQILPDGVLTIVCKIAVQEPTEETYTKNQLKEKSISKLQLDFQRMLDNGTNSDLVLRVSERDFRVHRNMLSARSEVFANMLFHGMKEKITGLVQITDTDPDVFSDFLYYLYTGSIDRITFENVQELYVTADKYQVSELQTQCVYLIEKNLSDDNVAEFVNLGLRHNDRELIETVSRFLSKRAEVLP